MAESEQPAEPEVRRCETCGSRICEKCGGPYDQPSADSHIPVCVQCLREQSWPPTEDPARLTR